MELIRKEDELRRVYDKLIKYDEKLQRESEGIFGD